MFDILDSLRFLIIISGMQIRKLIFLNDDRLRQQAKKVTDFSPGLKQLGQDMLATMRAHHGVGLAGPQIGVMQRIFVAEIPLPDDDQEEPRHPQAGQAFILINPEIVNKSNTEVEAEEGCLSIPGFRGLVSRPDWVEVKAQTVEGRQIKLKAEGLLARIFQHEMDHLEGRLYLDHITDSSKIWRIDPENESPETANAGQIVSSV